MATTINMTKVIADKKAIQAEADKKWVTNTFKSASRSARGALKTVELSVERINFELALSTVERIREESPEDVELAYSMMY